MVMVIRKVAATPLFGQEARSPSFHTLVRRITAATALYTSKAFEAWWQGGPKTSRCGRQLGEANKRHQSSCNRLLLGKALAHENSKGSGQQWEKLCRWQTCGWSATKAATCRRWRFSPHFIPTSPYPYLYL